MSAAELTRRFTLRIAIVVGLAACWSAPAFGGSASAAPRALPSVGFQPVPRSVAADTAGNVYLSNPQANGQVQRFTADGTLLARWGHFSSDPEYTPYPRGLATDAAGNVFVADSRIGQLRVFSADGSLIRQWMASTRDIAVGPDGFVYIVNSRHVQKFTAEGSLVAEWGDPNDDRGEFGSPWGIATGPTGEVYVANTYRDEIQVYSADGGFLTAWGGPSSDSRQFVFPYGIATDPAGNVYVADTGNARIQKFTADGSFLTAWGSPGRGQGNFLTPTSVATDPAGNVYVADAGEPYPDAGNARVQKFTPEGNFVTQWYGAPALPRPARPRLFTRLGDETAKHVAVFRFRSRQREVHFQCRLHGGRRVPRKLRRWQRCASPKRYTGLRPGGKFFEVRALKGEEAGEPASRTWRIVKRGRRLG